MQTFINESTFFFKIYIILISCSPLFASQKLTYDINMSPYAGANDLLFGTRTIEQFQPFKELTSKARFCRLNELVLFYLPLNYFTSIVQHEVFGHGFRIRDINHNIVKVTGYDFTLPPPYGPGSASTSFWIDTDRISTTNLDAISVAGFEAQSILANTTKFNWLATNGIDGRETVLYLVSQYGINLYAQIEEDDFGHDIFGYLFALNLTYTDSVLTEDRIRTLSWINLIDPFTYYSTYAWFRYISCGAKTPIPMIPIGQWGYLFGARLGLTPFGPEYFMDNYLLNEQKAIYFYLKAGAHAKNNYYGAGFYAPSIYKEKWALGTRIDVWKQPKILPSSYLPYPSSKQHSKLFGAAASLIFSYEKSIGFEAEAGYKTSGYLPGYPLRASPTIRLSILTSF